MNQTREQLLKQVDPRFIFEARRHLAQKNLIDFYRFGWHIVEPKTVLSDNWHIGAICEYLTAAVNGDIKNLLITMPPRHSKSLCISIFFPAWVWTKWPEARFVYASYAEGLALEHSVKCRRVIESDWYKSQWPHFTLTTDQNVKHNFENSRTGTRQAFGVDGGITGKGGDFIIADDPHNISGIHSKVKREAVITWWREVISTRLNDQETGRKIVVMQRGHQQDLAGYLIKSGIYTHLNLPGIAESKQTITLPISKKEKIREEGALLWPEKFNGSILDNLKKELGSFGFAAQIQQKPAPEGGAIWKREWWGYYSQLVGSVEFMLQSWDTAFKKKEENDYSVCTTWMKTEKGFYLVDLWRKRVEFPELKRQVVGLYNKWKPNKVIVEDKASGQSLIQEIKRETILPIFPVKVDSDKVARANAVSPTIEAGAVWLPENAEWLVDFLEESENFPNSTHDDQVDSVSQALAELVELGKPKVSIWEF